MAKSEGHDFVVINHNTVNTDQLPFEHIRVKTVRTEWGHTVNAHIEMFKVAIEQKVDKVVFLSESCVPITTPHDVFTELQHPYTVVMLLGQHDSDAHTITQAHNRNIPLGWTRHLFHEHWCVIDKAHLPILCTPHFLTNECINRTIRYDNEWWVLARLRFEGLLSEVRTAPYWWIHWPNNSIGHPFTYYSREFIQSPASKLLTDKASLLPFTTETATKLKESPAMFARKFHSSTEPLLWETFLS